MRGFSWEMTVKRRIRGGQREREVQQREHIRSRGGNNTHRRQAFWLYIWPQTVMHSGQSIMHTNTSSSPSLKPTGVCALWEAQHCTSAGSAAAERAKEDLGSGTSWRIQPQYEVRPSGRPLAAGHGRPEHKQSQSLKSIHQNRSTREAKPINLTHWDGRRNRLLRTREWVISFSGRRLVSKVNHCHLDVLFITYKLNKKKICSCVFRAVSFYSASQSPCILPKSSPELFFLWFLEMPPLFRPCSNFL